MWLGLLLSICSPCAAALATESSTPEAVIRTVVRANAERDLPTMSRLMAHDEDCINYTIGGRKYVGWSELAKDLQEEFETVTNLEIPIHELTVWTRGEIAWFAMEIDYIRYLGQGSNQVRNVLPLRDTGVLERRNGTWILVAWHESFRNPGLDVPAAALSKTRK
jgi:SnoaL-like domain